jgi:type II secretory pathway pseudopilin PulG
VRSLALLLATAVVCGASGLLWPAYQEARRESVDRALDADLSALNGAVDAFKRDHAGAMPGRDGDAVRADLLMRQLTLPTAGDGMPHEKGSYGPYLRAGLPPNPLDQVDDVRIVAKGGVPEPDGNGGWLFHVPTGRFHSNRRR